jgi:AAA+ ATPase superfamily predicted ATPase
VSALPKPGRIFGRDREWRSLADFVADDRPEATLGIVSGRRRQGKTYLLRSLAEATNGFLFEAGRGDGDGVAPNARCGPGGVP